MLPKWWIKKEKTKIIDECCAVWGKGEKGVLEQIKDVEKMLPFPLLGFDSNNRTIMSGNGWGIKD